MFFRKGLFGSPEERFWKWFEANEATIYNFEEDRETVLDQLSAALKRIHGGLAFEISSKVDDGRREFVISAEGSQDFFPVVESLCRTAPPLKRWTIVKFRQRQGEAHNVVFGDKTISAESVRYLMVRTEDPSKVGILLFMPGYSEQGSDLFYGAGVLFIDSMLGEYDAATRIQSLDIFDEHSEMYPEAKPLCELAEHFDWHFTQRN